MTRFVDEGRFKNSSRALDLPFRRWHIEVNRGSATFTSRNSEEAIPSDRLRLVRPWLFQSRRIYFVRGRCTLAGCNHCLSLRRVEYSSPYGHTREGLRLIASYASSE